MLFNNEIIKLNNKLDHLIVKEFTIKKIIKSGDTLKLWIIPYHEFDSWVFDNTPEWYQEWVASRMDFYIVEMMPEDLDNLIIRTGRFL